MSFLGSDYRSFGSQPKRNRRTNMSEQAAEAFEGVEQTLAAVEQHLAVLRAQPLDEFLAPLAPIERAKVNVSIGKRFSHQENVSMCQLYGWLSMH